MNYCKLRDETNFSETLIFSLGNRNKVYSKIHRYSSHTNTYIYCTILLNNSGTGSRIAKSAIVSSPFSVLSFFYRTLINMTVSIQALRKRDISETLAGLKPTCTPISAPSYEMSIDALASFFDRDIRMKSAFWRLNSIYLK